MSQLAIGNAPGGRYSKRKRATVNYYIGDSENEEEQGDDYSEEVVESNPAKKRSKSRNSRPRPSPKEKTFAFMELPAEIRNIIYDLCLHEPKGIYLASTTEKFRRTVQRAPKADIELVLKVSTYRNGGDSAGSDGVDENDLDALAPRTLVPSLLAVNRQIYKEGRDILYSNAMRLLDPLALHSFMVNIGPRAASLIKDVTLCSWGGWRGMHKAYNHASFAAMVSATNIEKFKLDGWLMCKNEPKYVARQMYRDGFPWLEAVGLQKGSMEAAVKLIDVAPVNFQRRYWQRRDETRNHESDMEKFRAELVKLLDGHLKNIKAPAKKTKAAKA